MNASYCGACGRPAGEGEHRACAQRRALEPPRYCPKCARRLVVQVTPAGFTAGCSIHGNVLDDAHSDSGPIGV